MRRDCGEKSPLHCEALTVLYDNNNYYSCLISWIHLLRCTPFQLHLRQHPDIEYLSWGIYGKVTFLKPALRTIVAHIIRHYHSSSTEGLGDQLYTGFKLVQVCHGKPIAADFLLIYEVGLFILDGLSKRPEHRLDPSINW